MARLTAFVDPWADPRGIGYHPIQSMLAIAMGGLSGRGLGNGIQKFGYLPEDTTDFIFAIICEELGLGGAALVVALYMAILWIGLGILRDCRDTFSRLVGIGVLMTIGLQALINMAVVTVVVPTKGIALPLISAGGTGWILTAAAAGLLAALDAANHLQDETTYATPHLATSH
jgi:cell division protein FtsW